MKKLIVLFLCLIFAVTAFACGGNSGGTNNNTDSGNNGGSEITRDSEDYYPDEAVAGENTFSFTKGNNGKSVVLKVGGTRVLFAGFELFIKFDKGVKVRSVTGKNGFGSISYSTAKDGQVKLVWAANANVTEACDICEIAFDMSGISSTKLTMSIPVGGLGYIDSTSNPPVKSIRATLTDYTLN